VTKAQALEDIWSLERLALRVRRDNRNHRADGSAPRGQVLRSHASPGPYRAQDKRMARVSEVQSLFSFQQVVIILVYFGTSRARPDRQYRAAGRRRPTFSTGAPARQGVCGIRRERSKREYSNSGGSRPVQRADDRRGRGRGGLARGGPTG